MAHQVTVNFNKLPVTFVIKRRMFQARKNVHLVFTVGPWSILVEFPLSNSMELLRGLERASRPTPKANKPLTKKAIKNQKRNKRRSDKRRAKSDAPKLAPSPALELAKTNLKRAFQQRSSSMACPSMARPFNSVLTPRPSQLASRWGTHTKEAPTTRATIQPRQVQVPTSAPRQAQVPNLPMRRDGVPSPGPIHTWAPVFTRKGAKTSKQPLTLRTPNKPFGEGTSGVKKAPQVFPTRWIFIGTIPVDIPAAEVMMTSYSEEETMPKTAKVKFVKPSTSSTSTMGPRLLQITTTTPPQSLIKGRRILPCRPKNQSDLTSEGIKSQAYSGPITRSRAKALSYPEVALQSSATTF